MNIEKLKKHSTVLGIWNLFNKVSIELDSKTRSKYLISVSFEEFIPKPSATKFNAELSETSEAYNKLSNLAKQLGVESVEAFAEMSKFLKIDYLGYSTMSMSEECFASSIVNLIFR